MKSLKIFGSLSYLVLILPVQAVEQINLQGHEGMGSECVLIDSSWVLAPKELANQNFSYGVKLGSNVYEFQELVPLYTNQDLVLVRLREPAVEVKPIPRLRYQKGFQFPAGTKLIVTSSELKKKISVKHSLNSPERIVLKSDPLQSIDNDVNIENKFLFIDHWTMLPGTEPAFDRAKTLSGTLNIFAESNRGYKLARIVYQAKKDQFQPGILLDKGVVKIEPFSPKENTEIDNIIIQHALQLSEVTHLFTPRKKIDLSSEKGIGYQSTLIDSSWVFVGPNLKIEKDLRIGPKKVEIELEKGVRLFRSNLASIYPLKEPVLEVRPVQRARLNLDQPFRKGTKFVVVVMGPEKRRMVESDLSSPLQKAYEFQSIIDVSLKQLYQIAREMLPVIDGSTGSGAIYLINKQEHAELIGFVGFENIALPQITNTKIDNAIIKRALEIY